MYKGAFLKQSRGRFVFSPFLPHFHFFFSRLNFRALTRSETLATHARFPSFCLSKVTPKCIIPIYPDAHVTPKSRPLVFWHLQFEKLTIHARTWLDARCNFSLAPIQMGPYFIRQKGDWARIREARWRLFGHERNSTSILVMSVSSCREGHRSRQKLNETSFCKFKCKKFCKFSKFRFSFPVGRLASAPVRNSEIYVLLKSGNWRAMPLERAWVLKGNLL